MRRFFRPTLAGLLALAGLFAPAPRCSAALLYDISPTGGGSPFSGFSGNWGFNFTISTNTNVASLGLWDEGANGLAGPHQVGIFQSTGGAALVSATVGNSSTAVTSTNSAGRWLFTDLASPFALAAGTYTLAFFNPSGATDPFRGNATGNFLPGATWGVAKARSGAASFAWPDANSGGINQGWFGANLSTTALVPSGSAVPEPATLASAAFAGLAALAGVARRRKGAAA